MLTFRGFLEASALIDERAKARRLIDTDHCGVRSVGEYLDSAAINAVIPAHRAWLKGRLDAIDARLTELGIDINSPVAWQDAHGFEQGVA